MAKNIPKTIPGVLLFFVRKNKRGQNEYLLHLRKNTGFNDDLYCVPGGHVEDKETYKDCAVREAKEETNTTVKKQDLKFSHLICRKGNDNNSNDYALRPDACFIVKKWTGKIKNKEPKKHGAYEWKTKDQLFKVVPYVKKAIEYIENNVFYSEFGFL